LSQITFTRDIFLAVYILLLALRLVTKSGDTTRAYKPDLPELLLASAV
jgi:hypothetical protein